jgi:hypothetical protein
VLGVRSVRMYDEGSSGGGLPRVRRAWHASERLDAVFRQGTTAMAATIPFDQGLHSESRRDVRFPSGSSGAIDPLEHIQRSRGYCEA